MCLRYFSQTAAVYIPKLAINTIGGIHKEDGCFNESVWEDREEEKCFVLNVVLKQ